MRSEPPQAISAEPCRNPQRRRCSSEPGERRDPARTRQLILDSASEEFGRFGFDGARVMRIADRAGVAHQSITYHFGGKRGLFNALSDRWIETSTSAVTGDTSFVEALSRLVQQANADPAWGRALIREGRRVHDQAGLVDRLAPVLANTVERQARGELHPDLDPGIVSLLLFAANMAPIAMPHITRALSSVDPADSGFADYYAEQLGQVVRRLGTDEIR